MILVTFYTITFLEFPMSLIIMLFYKFVSEKNIWSLVLRSTPAKHGYTTTDTLPLRFFEWMYWKKMFYLHLWFVSDHQDVQDIKISVHVPTKREQYVPTDDQPSATSCKVQPN